METEIEGDSYCVRKWHSEYTCSNNGEYQGCGCMQKMLVEVNKSLH